MKFLALQCFSCRAMQVKQSKKASNKWSCGICNEKQSQRKVFFSSDAAKDVRNFVQHSNLARGLSEEALGDGIFPLGTEEDLLDFQNVVQEFASDKQQPEPNKWERFLSKENFSDDEEGRHRDDAKYVTSIPDPKPRNPRRRSVASTGGAPKRGAYSAQKRSGSVTAGSSELMKMDPHSAYSKPKSYGVCDDKDIELSSEKGHFSARHVPSQSGTVDGEYIEGTYRRGYAMLAGESSHEETRASKPQHQASKWSKYLELDDG